MITETNRISKIATSLVVRKMFQIVYRKTDAYC